MQRERKSTADATDRGLAEPPGVLKTGMSHLGRGKAVSRSLRCTEYSGRSRSVCGFSMTAILWRYSIRWTHWLRQGGASKGSVKYCVSCTTLPLRNSMMLTV